MKKLWGKFKYLISFNKSPYYLNRYYKESLLTKYDNCLHFESYRKSMVLLKDVSTNIDIGTDLNKSQKQIRAKHGKPNFKLNKTYIKNHVILYYKFIIAGYKSKCEFHLHNSKVFYISYSFSGLDSNEKTDLIRIVSQKYTKDSLDYNKLKLIDSLGNNLSINDSVELTINYLNPNSEFVFLHNISYNSWLENIEYQKKRKEKMVLKML